MDRINPWLEADKHSPGLSIREAHVGYGSFPSPKLTCFVSATFLFLRRVGALEGCNCRGHLGPLFSLSSKKLTLRLFDRGSFRLCQ